MSFHVPANQTVSFSVYNQAIAHDTGLPHEFLKANAHRIHRAFDHGEPIWMIVVELNMVHDITRGPAE